MINEFFRAKYVTYKASELRESEYFFLLLFPLPHQHLFYHISTALASLFSAVVGFVSTHRLVLQFCDFFLMLEADSRRRSI